MTDEFRFANQDLQSARLAEMAYATSRDLTQHITKDSSPGQIAQILQSTRGLSTTEASSLASGYTVIATTADTAFGGNTGLNAILLKAGDGSYVLSISGVDNVFSVSPFNPIQGSDFSQTSARTNDYGFNDIQYAELRRFYNYASQGQSINVLDVVGHSLGGQLGTVFYADQARLGNSAFIRQVVTFGAFGINSNALYNNLFSPSISGSNLPFGLPGPQVAEWREILATMSKMPTWKIINYSNYSDPIPVSPAISLELYGPLEISFLYHYGTNITLLNANSHAITHDLSIYRENLPYSLNNVASVGHVTDLWNDLLMPTGTQDPDEIVVTARRSSIAIGPNGDGLHEITVTAPVRNDHLTSYVDPVTGITVTVYLTPKLRITVELR